MGCGPETRQSWAHYYHTRSWLNAAAKIGSVGFNLAFIATPKFYMGRPFPALYELWSMVLVTARPASTLLIQTTIM
ncbi:hypothetical protein K491DRAFT_5063 [Lophiostoma macrostomum CBS 122681]|uniref:Uncharacterized protein n=1 Tax=Lophiostoma macrostomum CBS 122681 TaxID=1314788 RepID=A0A6A6TS12_9PLEO|nr:hypothetical protein K491DRAFT_5063 [Lophiostoma macrostomum CBS 122681]